MTWQDEGVAIPKYKNGLGDIETGSTVVDYDNTAGFGKGAVIAVLTQQDQGVQRQSLFQSTDGGYSFTAFDANPVMENPGETHWRDPKIIRDEANGQWLMTLAEGGKLGIYTSTDLKSWRYTSSVELPGLGTLECPDLFQLDLDGDPAKRTWVLAASGNGAGEGGTTGVAYWTGGWDGTTFTPAGDGHQWLDAGSDFYAAVTWDDPRLTEGQRMQSRQAIGWVNNWDYARKLPTADWHGGMDSIVRDLRLKTVRGKPTLVSTPARALAGLEGPPVTSGPAAITPDGTAGLPAVNGSAYRLDLTLEADGGRETGAGDATALLQLGRGERRLRHHRLRLRRGDGFRQPETASRRDQPGPAVHGTPDRPGTGPGRQRGPDGFCGPFLRRGLCQRRRTGPDVAGVSRGRRGVHQPCLRRAGAGPQERTLRPARRPRLTFSNPSELKSEHCNRNGPAGNYTVASRTKM